MAVKKNQLVLRMPPSRVGSSSQSNTILVTTLTKTIHSQMP